MKKMINNKKMKRKPAKELERKPGKYGPTITSKEDTGDVVAQMKEGGYCRGAGAAIKGTDFKGVF